MITCNEALELLSAQLDGAITIEEETALQEIPAELRTRLRARNLCLRQLARHLVKGDTIYEAK